LKRQAISEGSKGACMGEAKFVDVDKKWINARTVYRIRTIKKCSNIGKESTR